MTDKIKSEIIRIDLSSASYAGTKSYIEPTYINFFFGNNGSGKSTIAKAIQNGVGVTFSSGKSMSDYLPLVFNQEFINDNVHSYNNLKGVFTLNAKNVDIQQKIDAANADYKDVQACIKDTIHMHDDYKDELDKITLAFQNKCWDRVKPLRDEFKKAMKGKLKKDVFAKEILRHDPCSCDIEEIRRLYNSAFDEDKKRYTKFNEIIDIAVLDKVANADILSKPIVNSADTDLARFLKEIGATDWMHKGHDLYSHKANGKCPYCGQELSENFEQTFIESFDEQYKKKLDALNQFLSDYRDKANHLFVPLKAPNVVYPSIDIKPYSDKLMVLKSTISSNVEKIRNKISNPALVEKLESVTPILEEIDEMIKSFNKVIKENNDVVAAGPKKKDECTNKIFSYFASQLKDVSDTYRKSSAKLEKSISECEIDIKMQNIQLKNITANIRDLRKSTVETDTAKDKINNMLRDSGMQGFSLQPKPGVPNVYEVQRPDGTIAENLSEGEKNFIAFLYFYHLVYGSTSEEGDSREKIVVIDDPVSSMDSSSLFIVSALVKQMIEVCRNNADNRNRLENGNFIKQIFILTHNAYFHREITYNYVSKYEYVSFYYISKFDNKSSIRLCEEVNPNIPTEKMNVNPVKNSYAALWDEYKEIKSSVIPLMNVIRRILEYYFLQLCGYESSKLRQVILIKNKRKFITSGKFDAGKYQLATAMLSYIYANSSGMNDGRDFVDGGFSVTQCKEIFQMIFEEMDQKQHYDMMMGVE